MKSSATVPTTNVHVDAGTDDANETVALAMRLLLNARERVLTLSERRVSLI